MHLTMLVAFVAFCLLSSSAGDEVAVKRAYERSLIVNACARRGGGVIAFGRCSPRYIQCAEGKPVSPEGRHADTEPFIQRCTEQNTVWRNLLATCTYHPCLGYPTVDGKHLPSRIERLPGQKHEDFTSELNGDGLARDQVCMNHVLKTVALGECSMHYVTCTSAKIWKDETCDPSEVFDDLAFSCIPRTCHQDRRELEKPQP